MPLYNALHTWWTPIGLGLIALVVPVLVPFALGWAFHVAFDRVWGYGLRTADGYQRDQLDRQPGALDAVPRAGLTPERDRRRGGAAG